MTGSHPPAAAACRQVLPSVSGVSIWKPAERTESLHIMLNLRPEGGGGAREDGGREDGGREDGGREGGRREGGRTTQEGQRPERGRGGSGEKDRWTEEVRRSWCVMNRLENTCRDGSYRQKNKSS